jgi:hypothetical protein
MGRLQTVRSSTAEWSKKWVGFNANLNSSQNWLTKGSKDKPTLKVVDSAKRNTSFLFTHPDFEAAYFVATDKGLLTKIGLGAEGSFH